MADEPETLPPPPIQKWRVTFLGMSQRLSCITDYVRLMRDNDPLHDINYGDSRSVNAVVIPPGMPVEVELVEMVSPPPEDIKRGKRR